jgi:hypothetical protein
MAAHARQRQADAALLKMKGGETVLGLRLRALRPALSLRGDNSFALTVRVENTRSREQLIYDGPGGGYGVLIKPQNPGGAALVLRHVLASSGTDSKVLNLADETDFTTIKGQAFMAKELFFDAKVLPALQRVKGECLVAVFFSTEQDGRGLQLEAPVWTGTMVSEEVPLKFRVLEEEGKLPQP